MESSGWADFKTVPGFTFRATFEGDIEGFTLLKVMLATTVCMFWIETFFLPPLFVTSCVGRKAKSLDCNKLTKVCCHCGSTSNQRSNWECWVESNRSETRWWLRIRALLLSWFLFSPTKIMKGHRLRFNTNLNIT